MNDEGSIRVGNCHQRQCWSRLHCSYRAAVREWREDCVNLLPAADVEDIDAPIFPRRKDFVQIRGHVGNAGKLVSALSSSRGCVNRGVMFESCRLPDLDPRCAASNNPCPKAENLLDRLSQVLWDFELVNLLASLEAPQSGLGVVCATPGSEDLVLPCQRCSDILGGLWSREEDEVQSALQVVGLKTASDGGGDLEGRLSEWNRGKRYRGRRY